MKDGRALQIILRIYSGKRLPKWRGRLWNPCGMSSQHQGGVFSYFTFANNRHPILPAEPWFWGASVIYLWPERRLRDSSRIVYEFLAWEVPSHFSLARKSAYTNCSHWGWTYRWRGRFPFNSWLSPCFSRGSDDLGDTGSRATVTLRNGGRQTWREANFSGNT